MHWIAEHETRVLERRRLDFRKIYGTGFQGRQVHLFKYFVKLLGCKLVDADQPVPGDLVDLFDRTGFWTRLKVTFSVVEILARTKPGAKVMTHGPLIGHGPMSPSPPFDQYLWFTVVGWLLVEYWYNCRVPPHAGTPWIANTTDLRLGSYRTPRRR